jgi:hypothetical protein
MRPFVFIAIMGIAGALNSSPAQAQPLNPSSFSLTYRGFNYVSYYNGAYENADSLPALVGTGANAAALTFEYGIDVLTSTVYADATYTDSLTALAATITEANGRGLSVMVRPLIDFLDPTKIGSYSVGDWRSLYNPTDPAAFFASYKTMILNVAQVAQANGAAILCIGAELDQLTGPEYLSYWTDIIASVREVFSGKLTYSADWDDNISPWQGQYGLTAGTGNLTTQVSFWSQLDYLGIDCYAPISDAANPALADLVAGWVMVPSDPTSYAVTGNQSLISYFESVAAQTRMPLLFTEIGYESASDAAQQPSGTSTNIYDPALQASLYAAFFAAWQQNGNNSLTGVYFWNWDPNAAEVGPGNGPNFSPQGQPAQDVVAANFTALQVSPATGIAASGPQGGPFSPTSFDYQLSATSANLNYTISGIPSWLNVNVTSGTAANTPVTVTFSLVNAGILTPGIYIATIAFTDTSSGNGNTTRTATLAVNGIAPPPAPAVTAVAPASGPTLGRTSVTITGTNLTGATAVAFGSTAAATFNVTNATSIAASSPAGTGVVDVTVTTPGGTSATGTADQFTYIPVLQVTPATNMVTAANQGEPFVPPSFQYQLGTTAGGIDYSISGVPSWLTASVTSGTVSSGTTVTFTVNASANNLAVGTYGPVTITFTNSDSGQGTQTRTATLTMNAALATTTTCVKTSKVCPNLWWFNGASPQPTNYVTTIQSPTGGTDYTWTIEDGTLYAQFSNGSSTIDTKTKNSVEVLPNGDPGDGPPPIVSVTVVVKSKKGTATANPFILHLRKPYELMPGSIVDKSNATYGYQSQIYYQTLDQTGAVLPFPVPMNQDFGSLADDYSGTNWAEPKNCGTTGVCTSLFTPSNWYDLVEGAKTTGSVPLSEKPQSPLGSTAVDHWSGSWGVGNGHPGTGVTVQTNTWQRFRDHARHTNIVSPPP